MLHKLIDEQNLHPVARAMIDLQLHTPYMRHTQMKKELFQNNFIIIRQLHYVIYKKQVVIFLPNY